MCAVRVEGSDETLPAAIPTFREAPREAAAETLGKLREMVRVEPPLRIEDDYAGPIRGCQSEGLGFFGKLFRFFRS